MISYTQKLPKRVKVILQEIESGITKKGGKKGTMLYRSRTYQFLGIEYDEFIKRFETWIEKQSK